MSESNRCISRVEVRARLILNLNGESISGYLQPLGTKPNGTTSSHEKPMIRSRVREVWAYFGSSTQGSFSVETIDFSRLFIIFPTYPESVSIGTYDCHFARPNSCFRRTIRGSLLHP